MPKWVCTCTDLLFIRISQIAAAVTRNILGDEFANRMFTNNLQLRLSNIFTQCNSVLYCIHV